MTIVAICGSDIDASDDPVLDFYCHSAKSIFDGRNPLTRGAAFSFRATTKFSTIGEGGVPTLKDSNEVEYFYSFGQLDSTQVIVKSNDGMRKFEFDAPNIFDSTYIHSFFPNDTGGPELPIGFDSPTVESNLPNGVAIIDRASYFVKRLYLFFPNNIGYKRLSRIYSFALHDEYLIPETIVEQGAVSGIFTTTYFRSETNLTNIRIIRQSTTEIR